MTGGDTVSNTPDDPGLRLVSPNLSSSFNSFATYPHTTFSLPIVLSSCLGLDAHPLSADQSLVLLNSRIPKVPSRAYAQLHLANVQSDEDIPV